MSKIMDRSPISIAENKDCMDMMREKPDGFWDLVIADPPYGISYQSSRRTDKKSRKPKIQNDESPFIEWIEPLFEKMNDGGRLVCFYRWDVQDMFLNEIKRSGFTVKSQIVWDKVVHGMGDLLGEFAPQHELMIYATKGRFEFTGKRPKTIYRHQRVDPEKLIHPNEKPVDLLKNIILDLSQDGNKLFDPFLGSGSSRIAAWDMGLDYWGCDLDKDYFCGEEKRFAAHTSKPLLFQPDEMYNFEQTKLFTE